MEKRQKAGKRLKLNLINFGGRNRRFYAAGTAMLALILAPFALYAALNQGNQILSGLFFAVIAGSMLLVVIIS